MAITGFDPPYDLSGVYCFAGAHPDVQDALNDWAAGHASPSWATGLSMIEAAELIVERACENGNISRA